MKYRIIAAAMVGVMIVGLGASTFADKRARKSNASQLAALLPASDGVVIFDAKRFLGEALPQIFAGNQTYFAKITNHLTEFQTRTGIDPRQFESAAAGINARSLGEKRYDIDSVIIAQGQTPSATLIASAKTASENKFREERVGDRTIYILEARKVNVQTSTQALTTMPQIAITAIDERTIAFGDIARVRAALEGKTRISSELTGMLSRNPPAIASFAAKPPAGLRAFIPMDSDELGRNIDSIQYLYGSANVSGGNVAIQMTARTLQNAQATSLLETMQGLQMIGKAFLGASKAADKRALARLIENAKLSGKANEVMIDLTVPQADIDVLVGMLK